MGVLDGADRAAYSVGEHFDYEGWRFEIVDMDGRRIDKLLARRQPATGPTGSA